MPKISGGQGKLLLFKGSLDLVLKDEDCARHPFKLWQAVSIDAIKKWGVLLFDDKAIVSDTDRYTDKTPPLATSKTDALKWYLFFKNNSGVVNVSSSVSPYFGKIIHSISFILISLCNLSNKYPLKFSNGVIFCFMSISEIG